MDFMLHRLFGIVTRFLQFHLRARAWLFVILGPRTLKLIDISKQGLVVHTIYYIDLN